MRRLRLTVAAQRDLDAAFDHIAADNLRAAEQQRARLREAGQLLLEFPAIGAPHLGGPRRRLVVAGSPFALIYRQTAQGIIILRIHHGAREWPPAT